MNEIIEKAGKYAERGSQIHFYKAILHSLGLVEIGLFTYIDDCNKQLQNHFKKYHKKNRKG